MLVLAGDRRADVPVVLSEAGSFSETYPRILGKRARPLPRLDDGWSGRPLERVVEKAAAPRAMADDGPDRPQVGPDAVEGLFAGLTVFVVAYYWLTERVADQARLHLPVPPRPPAAGRHDLGRGRARPRRLGPRAASADAVHRRAAAVGYTLMGLKYALVLAILAGLLEIVPLVGPWLGAIPAILVALTQDVRLALLVAVYILVIQLVEGNVLVPRVMERTVGVSPLMVVVGILVGAALGGIPGALGAVPTAGALQVILKHLLLLDPDAAPEDAAVRAAVVQASMTDVAKLPVTPADAPSPAP